MRLVYLGYFIPDFNSHTNSRIAQLHGLQVRTGVDADPNATGGMDPCVALDDDFVVVNQFVKYLKFGFGKATQEVGSAIRAGLMTRADGIEAVRKYDGKCAPYYIDMVCAYLELSRDEFWTTVDRFVNRDLFRRGDDGAWEPTFNRRLAPLGSPSSSMGWETCSLSMNALLRPRRGAEHHP